LGLVPPWGLVGGNYFKMIKTFSKTPTVKKKVNLIKNFGGIMSFVSGKNEVWCSYGAHWFDADKCAVIDNGIKCEECIRKDHKPKP